SSGSANGSRGSRRAIAFIMTAASRTVRASGQTWATSSLPPAAGYIGTRAKVGLRPTSPQKLAGMRIEPAPSEPSASGANPAATAAAPPPVEPPGVRVGSQGLRDSPKSRLSVEPRPADRGKLGAPDEDRPGPPHPGTTRGSPGRDKAPHQTRAVRGALPGRPQVVLDRDGHAVKRPERTGGHHRLLGRAGRVESSLSMDRD